MALFFNPKYLILCPGAKNGPNFRGTIYPMTGLMTLNFEYQEEQGGDLSVCKGILKYSDFRLSYNMLKTSHSGNVREAIAKNRSAQL